MKNEQAVSYYLFSEDSSVNFLSYMIHKDFIHHQNPLDSAYQHCISTSSSVQVPKMWNVPLLQDGQTDSIC